MNGVKFITRCDDGKVLANPTCEFELIDGVGETPKAVQGGAEGRCKYGANEPPSSKFRIKISAGRSKPKTVTLANADKTELGVCLEEP